MNIENITIEQKKIIVAGIFALKDISTIEILELKEIDQNIKDFVLITERLRFFLLDVNADDEEFDLFDRDPFEDSYSDWIIKSSEEEISDFFIRYNCIEYINFVDFFTAIIKLHKITWKKMCSFLEDNYDLEDSDIKTIEECEYLKQLKNNNNNNNILPLFRELSYLDFNKRDKIRKLLQIQKTELIQNKNSTIHYWRFEYLFEHISKMSPIQLADFINSGAKNCINYIVELDYNFCKQKNYTVYKKDLDHLKMTHAGDLSRHTIGRHWKKMLYVYLFGDGILNYGNYFQDSDFDVDELDNTYDLIEQSWLKKLHNKNVF